MTGPRAKILQGIRKRFKFLTTTFELIFLSFAVGGCCLFPSNITTDEEIYSTLSPTRFAKTQDFHKDSTFKRKLTRSFQSDFEVYDYLLNRPVFIADGLRALKLQSYILKNGANGSFRFDDGKSLSGTLTPWAQKKGQRLYHAEALGSGPWGFTVAAEALLELTYQEKSPEVIESELKVWIKMEGLAAVLAQLVIPLVGDVFDRKIDALLKGGRELSRRMNQDPEKFIKNLESSEEIDPQDILQLKKFLKKVVKLDLAKL